MRALESAEYDAATGAMTLGSAMNLMVPVLGMIAAGISILAGISITQHRAAIPVAQTSPGQWRQVQGQGAVPIIAHGDELIGRPPFPGGGGEGSITNLQDTIVFNSEFDTRVYQQTRRFSS